MSVMDVRRLVRALGVGALVFLVLGGGIGVATASSSADADKETWTVAAPGPGDRATYRLAERVDRSEADPDLAMPDAKLDVEWKPVEEAAGADHVVRPAHVLGTTLRYTDRDRESHADVAFDAATGAPLTRTNRWGEAFTLSVGLGIGVADQESEGDYEGRREAVEGPLAPCGLRADLQGRPVAAGDAVQVFGGCEDDPTARQATYTVRGWDTLRGDRFLLLESPSGLRLHYDPELPVPVRVEARMLETWDAHFAKGRLFVLVLEAFHPGDGEYPPPPAQVPVGPGPVVPLAPLTPWMLDDTAVAHPFPLAQAHAAALDPAYYEEGEARVSDFLARHPGSYLAIAWGVHAEDSRGTPYDGWALLWTDGRDAIGKAVVHYPTLVFAADPVPGLPGQVTVTAWESEMSEDPRGLFPTAAALPEGLPSISRLWPVAQQALQSRLQLDANTYSYVMGCADQTCQEAEPIVFVGHTRYPGNTFELALQDQEGRTALVGVGGDGRPKVSYFIDSRMEAPFPVLPATAAPPAPSPASGPGSVAVASVGWAVPPAEAVAGVGLFALLASGAYYFWPAVKGGFLGLFSRIEPERVLDHSARKWLYTMVEANPGIHFQELLRRTNFGRGQLEHHLRKLERAELVSRVKGDSYACFFARGQVDRRVMAAAPLLRSDGGRSVLVALQQRPGATSRELAAQLGLATGTVSYHVKRLREAGMLESAGGALHLTETGQKASALAA